MSIFLRIARELRWSCTYERTCVFICACGCGTHVYSTRTGPGHGLRTPYRAGCTARVNTGACLLHFACVRAVRCSAWIVLAVVYLACVCVCVRQSARVARLVSFVQRFVCQRGQMCLVCPTPCAVCLGITGAVLTCPCWYSCWYLFYTVLRLVNPGNISFARARTRTGAPCAVPHSVSTGNVPTCPCSYLSCVRIVAQCVLCLYLLYSASAGPHG